MISSLLSFCLASGFAPCSPFVSQAASHLARCGQATTFLLIIRLTIYGSYWYQSVSILALREAQSGCSLDCRRCFKAEN